LYQRNQLLVHGPADDLQIDDETVFPQQFGAPFPPNFVVRVKGGGGGDKGCNQWFCSTTVGQHVPAAT
jgi:hypothetical protein